MSTETGTTDPDEMLTQRLRSTLDPPTIESLRYLFDVFIEGGFAEDAEDEFHLDAIFRWFESASRSGSSGGDA